MIKITRQLREKKKKLDKMIQVCKFSSYDMPQITVPNELYRFLWQVESYVGNDPPLQFIYKGALIKPLGIE